MMKQRIFLLSVQVNSLAILHLAISISNVTSICLILRYVKISWVILCLILYAVACVNLNICSVIMVKQSRLVKCKLVSSRPCHILRNMIYLMVLFYVF